MTGESEVAHLGELLSAFADGQLAGAEEQRARSHLAGCAACAEELAGVAEVRALVRSLPQVAPRRPLLAVPSRPARPGRLAGMLAASAAAVALLVLSGVEQQDPTAPQVAELVQVHSTSPVNHDPMSQLAPAVIPVALER